MQRGDCFADRGEEPVLSDALEEAASGEAVAYVLSGSGHREFDVFAVEFVQRLAERSSAGVVEVAHPDRVEHQQSWKWTAFAYHRGVANSTTSTPGTRVGPLGLLIGAQLVVCGMRPRTCSCGRALRRVRSRIASATATPIPCSTPTNATASRVITARANSNGSNRAIARRSRAWKIRAATNSSTPAKVATGTSFSSPAAGTSTRIAAAATSPAACVRPDAAATAAVLGGLEFTGNAPRRPAAMLPAPTPRKSRPTSTW